MKKILLGLLAMILSATMTYAEIPVQRNWQQVSFGGQSRYAFVKWDNSVSEQAFAAGNLSGLYKTIDSGRTWSHVGRGMPCMDVRSMSQSISSPDVFYAACGDTSNNSSYLGIWKSVDHAVTWTQLPGTSTWEYTTYGNNDATLIAISHTDPNIVYVSRPGASGGGIQKTVDGGTSWSEFCPLLFADGVYNVLLTADDNYLFISSVPTSGANVAVFDTVTATPTTYSFSGTYGMKGYQLKSYTVSSTEHVCFSTGYNINCTTDHGMTWTPSADATSGTLFIHNFDVAVDGSTVKIYATAGPTSETTSGTVRTSANGGASWTTPSQTLTNNTAINPDAVLNSITTYRQSSVAINPNNHNQVLSTSVSAVYNTDDFGENVINYDAGLANQVFSDVNIAPNGDIIACGMDIGVVKSSDNGVSWTNLVGARAGDYTAGLSGHYYRCIPLGTAGEWAAGTGVIVSTFTRWATEISSIVRSADNGATWTKITSPFPTVAMNYCRVDTWPTKALAVCPSDENIIAFGICGHDNVSVTQKGGIYFSTDKGATWSKSNYDTYPSAGAYTWAYFEDSLAFDPTDATCNTLALGLFAYGIVYTNDRWATEQTTHSNGQLAYVTGLAYKPGTSDVYTSGSGSAGLAPLAKNGTIIHRFPGTANLSTFTGRIYFDPTDAERAFVSVTHPARDSTVYVTDNISAGSGAIWTDLVGDNGELYTRQGSKATMTIKTTEGSLGTLYYGTWGSGIFKLSLSPEAPGPTQSQLNGATLNGFNSN